MSRTTGTTVSAMGELILVFGVVPVCVLAWFTGTFAPSPLAPGSLAALLPPMLVASALGASTVSLRILLPMIAGALYLLGTAPMLSRRFAWHTSAVAYVVVLASDAMFFASYWRHGVRYQGEAHTWMVLGLNLVCALCVGAGLGVARHQRSYTATATCHVGLFAWVNWVAFPWFGEML